MLVQTSGFGVQTQRRINVILNILKRLGEM
jgi:hypothetical protein